jgi:hypothetical protein
MIYNRNANAGERRSETIQEMQGAGMKTNPDQEKDSAGLLMPGCLLGS